MSNTIAHKEIENWWDGKVIIDEIRQYVDDRGTLVELWRSDDDKNNNDGFSGGTKPEMSYWSETKPWVIRGPHQHEKQCDNFITYKGVMIYQLYNPETREMKYFITDKDKIYRVKVAPPIVHSYRNIQTETILTGNFPTALFMGKDKLGYKPEHKIDEIRHEESIQPSRNIWVFGSNGRLGSALVKSLFNHMEYHSYNVIPVGEKFKNQSDDIKKLTGILDEILKNKTENDIVINCIAKTNVQNSEETFLFENVILQNVINTFCVKNEIRVLAFSSDYVYQTGDLSKYTQSKIKFEEQVLNCLQSDDSVLYKKYLKVIRLANLFSLKPNDTHNVINKVYKNFVNKNVSVPKDLFIMPTSVEQVSEFLVKSYIPNYDKFNFYTNVSGPAIDVVSLLKNNLTLKDEDIEYTILESSKTVCNYEDFLNYNHVLLDCSIDIFNKFTQNKDNK